MLGLSLALYRYYGWILENFWTNLEIFEWILDKNFHIFRQIMTDFGFLLVGFGSMNQVPRRLRIICSKHASKKASKRASRKISDNFCSSNLE